MTCKERVYAAVNREPCDKIPRFIWFGEHVARRLSARLGISPQELDVRAGNDILQTWLSINAQMARPAAEGERFTDEWGILWERQGDYNMVVGHPLAGKSAEQIAAHSLPDPLLAARYDKLKALRHDYPEHFIGADVSGSIWEPSYHLRGMEELMLDLAMENEEASVLLDRVCEFTLAVALESCRLGADWLWLGDDIGTQSGMMMSPDMWRQWLKPRMKQICDAVHARYPDQIIAYHSCGSMSPVAGDLADLGIRIINPIQESAKDMDHAAFKKAYGSRVTMACGLDTQSFMVLASPAQVRAAVREKAAVLSRGGGYIFAVSHTLQADVSDENILAMLDELDNIAPA